MLRVGVLVGLCLACAPPLLYWRAAGAHLAAEATTRAESLARPIGILAINQPGLWRYNLDKVVRATAAHREVGALGQVRVTDCDGATIFSSAELGVARPDAVGPLGWAPVTVVGGVAAWVAVQMDAGPSRRRTAKVALAALLVGLVLGGLVYVLPVRAVRAQAVEVEVLLERVAVADASLHSANRDLHRRVQEAVVQAHHLSERVLSIQESERRRIARDLHDTVGQQLAGLRYGLERAVRHPEEAAERIEGALTAGDGALTELRHAIYDLRSPELDEGGLVGAVRAITERFELRTGLPVSLRHEGEIACPDPLAAGLLRIVQEALSNIARHAEAEEVGVVLCLEAARITLEIVDDGRGFVSTAARTGTGLDGMAERARFLGGTLTVDSQPGSGTRLVVVVSDGSPGAQG